MDRRRFLGTAAVGGAGLSLGAGGCAPSDGGPRARAGGDGGATIRPFELDEVTVDQLQASMESGERTARSITELCLQRIEEMDGRGPELRSIIETNPDALDIADQLDAERRDSGPRGPLHGIPVAIKDNIDTGEISFADAAKQFSQCPSKGKGGSLGSFRKLGTLLFLPYEGQDVPEFDAAVWSVPVGEVSAVTTSFGVHLLRVDARGSPE